MGEHLRLDGASYVRVMNPADGDTDHPRSWASIADDSVSATTSWNDVAPLSPAKSPQEGGIFPATARALARVLAAHTTTPDDCYFMIWEGYSGPHAPEFPPVLSFETPSQRRMLILNGTVSDGAESFKDWFPNDGGPPWWIPRDGAWLVGNDIYARSVYVAAREEVIQEILSADDLEAYRTTADMWIIGEEFADD